ncbi:YbaN family protein [Comamonas sp. NLF-1-9]|nr:YbaN family protein [Comamonas sp. NLF-1-9]
MSENPSQSPALPDLPPPLPAPLRWLLLALALLSLATGIVGIFLPGLPTTVFILIAAWAAARSSPRLHAWLWRHRLFGPMLRNWADGGRVSRRAKWSATLVMGSTALILAVVNAPTWARWFAWINMACVLVWLWHRPEPGKP